MIRMSQKWKEIALVFQEWVKKNGGEEKWHMWREKKIKEKRK